jgi:transcription elongation GreA/GreB family factor
MKHVNASADFRHDSSPQRPEDLVVSLSDYVRLREVELVYPDEADHVTGRVSVLAPVGCALLGLSVGQSIDWDLQGGKVHRLRVERVLSQSLHSGTESAAVETC